MLSECDHRKLGRELDLFHFQEQAPGAVFWHARGLSVMQRLEEHVRRVVREDGYEEVRTPLLLSRPIWEASGHWDKFSGEMMRLGDKQASFALKPVSCPAHIQIVRLRGASHRHLPLRIAEMGLVHRNERRSQLLGLFRLRQFVQDDGHVFCEASHVGSEVARFVARVRRLYEALGFGPDRQKAALSLRPRVRAGSDALWDRAESILAAAVRDAGLDCVMQPGAGAFYGPKLEIVLEDHALRPWQCGTLQLDFVMPERFGLDVVDAQRKRRPMVMIHRAMLGSFERFLGVLLEHHRGKLPPWLAPESVRVLPIGRAHAAYAESIVRALSGRGVRAELDSGQAPVGKRIFAVHAARVPLAVVVGTREEKKRSVVLREGNDERELDRDEALAVIASRCAPPPV